MMTIVEVEFIHQKLIEVFGGANGVRDRAALESALARPFQTFDSIDLYSSPIQKAAALVESILINHPFIDGNKRIGYVMMRMFLEKASIQIEATQDEKYEMIIAVASGNMRYEEIVMWLEQKCVQDS